MHPWLMFSKKGSPMASLLEIFAAVSGIILMTVIVLLVGYFSYIRTDLERQGHVIQPA
jgi:hypothetical protein